MRLKNDRARAVAVMRETAAWAKRRGIALGGSWTNPAGDGKEFFIFIDAGRVCGACVLRDSDADGEWEKYGRAGRHLYVGKLCVADGCHGRGVAREMLDAIKRKAAAGKYDSIRLVADVKIAPIYINAGFFPHWGFVGGKTGRTFARLAWYPWTPDQFEKIWRGPGRLNLRRIAYRAAKKMIGILGL